MKAKKKSKNKKREGAGRRKGEDEGGREEEERGDNRIRTGMAKLFVAGCKIYTKTFLPVTATLVANPEWESRGYSTTRCERIQTSFVLSAGQRF
jgi:hypothetical protein